VVGKWIPISFVTELHYFSVGCLGFVARNTTREEGCIGKQEGIMGSQSGL